MRLALPVLMKKKSEKGQGLVEYLILVCLVAVSAMWVVSTVGRNIQEQYANISRALTHGEGRGISKTEAPTESYQGRGMGDFMENARTSGTGRAR